MSIEKKVRTKTRYKDVEEHEDFWVTSDGWEFSHQETAEKWERVLSIPHRYFPGEEETVRWYYFRFAEDYDALILYHVGTNFRNWSISPGEFPGIGWYQMDLKDYDGSDYPSNHLYLTPKANVLAVLTKTLNIVQSLPEVVP